MNKTYFVFQVIYSEVKDVTVLTFIILGQKKQVLDKSNQGRNFTVELAL